MMSFWLYTALLILLGLVFVILPFVRKEQGSQINPGQNAQRIDIYHQRLSELSDEQQLAKINPEDYQQTLIELKNNLLNELSDEGKLNTKGNNLTLIMSAALFLLSFTCLFYYFSGNHQQLQSWQQAQIDLPEFGKRAVLQEGEPLTENELQAFALGLRTKLAHEGDDEMAWMLLGRVLVSLGDYKTGMQAYDKVLNLNPDNSGVLLSYSQLLLMAGRDDGIIRASKMLSRVLIKQPDNIDAISLLGLIAYEKGDLLEAKTAFEMILLATPETDPSYLLVKQKLDEVTQELMTKNTNKNIQIDSGQTKQIRVKISIAAELDQHLPEKATLFVFAKAANGPPMPLAVVKKTAFNLPLEVSLTEQDAMIESLSLAKFDQVIVTARISKDENVEMSAGELQGVSAVVDLNKKDFITLNIDKLLN